MLRGIRIRAKKWAIWVELFVTDTISAGTATYTPPANVDTTQQVLAEAWAAGGGATGTGGVSGAGGAGGGYASQDIKADITPGSATNCNVPSGPSTGTAGDCWLGPSAGSAWVLSKSGQSANGTNNATPGSATATTNFIGSTKKIAGNGGSPQAAGGGGGGSPDATTTATAGGNASGLTPGTAGTKNGATGGSSGGNGSAGSTPGGGASGQGSGGGNQAKTGGNAQINVTYSLIVAGIFPFKDRIVMTGGMQDLVGGMRN